MRTALLWIWFSSAYYRKEKETSERKIEFGLLFWDPSDVQWNGHVLSDVLDPFDRPVCQQNYAAVSVSLSFCLSTSLQSRRPECLCMGFITGSCSRAPLTSHVFPSGDGVAGAASGRHMCRGDRGGYGRRCGDEWQLQGQWRAWLPAQTATLGTHLHVKEN